MEDEIAHIARRFEALAAELNASEYEPFEQSWEPPPYGARTRRQMHSTGQWWSSSASPSDISAHPLSELKEMGRAFEQIMIGVIRRMQALEARFAPDGVPHGSHRLVGPPPAVPIASPNANAGRTDWVDEGELATSGSVPSNDLLARLAPIMSVIAETNEMIKELTTRFVRFETFPHDQRRGDGQLRGMASSIEALRSAVDAISSGGLQSIRNSLAHVVERLDRLDAGVASRAESDTANNRFFVELGERISLELESVRKELNGSLQQIYSMPADSQPTAMAITALNDSVEILSLRIESLIQQRSETATLIETSSSSLDRVAAIDEKLESTTSVIERIGNLVGELHATWYRSDETAIGWLDDSDPSGRPPEPPAMDGSDSLEAEGTAGENESSYFAGHELEGLPFDTSSVAASGPPGSERRHLFRRFAG